MKGISSRSHILHIFFLLLLFVTVYVVISRDCNKILLFLFLFFYGKSLCYFSFFFGWDYFFIWIEVPWWLFKKEKYFEYFGYCEEGEYWYFLYGFCHLTLAYKYKLNRIFCDYYYNVTAAITQRQRPPNWNMKLAKTKFLISFNKATTSSLFTRHIKLG